MKAIVQERYGSTDVLRLTDVPEPTPGEHDVLIRVHAASVNARDWHLMRGDPYVARLMGGPLGLRAPRLPIRGSDVAGRVESVGRAVTRFQPGDEVYADSRAGDGALAEYACVHESVVETKPANLTFEQAAAVPLAATTALVALRDVAGVQSGQRVLINGASGGVGTFAVQLARALGAQVTGVCSPRNAELIRSLGADHVVLYSREDFSRTDERYDVVFDLVGNRRLADCRRALIPTGTLVLAGGGVSEPRAKVIGPVGLTLKGVVMSRLAKQRVLPLMEVAPGATHLADLRKFIEAGSVMPAIDRTFPLVDAAQAIRYLQIEHARAKVVVLC